MFKKCLFIVISLLAFLPTVYSATVYSADNDHAMTKEQHQQDRQARRAEWEALSEGEKQARRDERMARFDAMSDEEREAMKQRRHQYGMSGNRGQRGDGSGQRGHAHPAPEGG